MEIAAMQTPRNTLKGVVKEFENRVATMRLSKYQMMNLQTL